MILSKFEGFSIYTVLSAGILDGINPCAFTTIVFFIAFLGFAGYSRRQMILAGGFFTLAVFIAYLLIGLGIFNFLKSLKALYYVTRSLNAFMVIVTFFLGTANIVDYFRIKGKNDAKNTLLKLPQSIRNKINSLIGLYFREDGEGDKRSLFKIIWAAFIVGFMISVLESFCTGQIYLPTIVFVLGIPEKRVSAAVYLVLYNLAFIFPLIIVFFLGVFGVTSKAFSSFMERRIGMIKLATAALFFFLGAMLIIFQ